MGRRIRVSRANAKYIKDENDKSQGGDLIDSDDLREWEVKSVVPSGTFTYVVTKDHGIFLLFTKDYNEFKPIMGKKIGNRKVAVFTGAGISAESGIPTFRTGNNAMWDDYDLNDVATPRGWQKDRELVLEFYNKRKEEMNNAKPNAAHIALGELEKHCPVTVITQNIDTLHEQGGSKNVLHIHGNINQARSTVDHNLIIDHEGPIELGEKCEKGSQLRPHVVWFEEYPFFIDEAIKAIQDCGYLIIVGTALQINYTPQILSEASKDCKIYFIDPNPVKYLDSYRDGINYIEKKASEGVPEIVNKIINYEI